MRGAYIRGTGLSCALGRDVNGCVAAMRNGQLASGTLTLDWLAEPLCMRYYRIPDQANLFDAARFDVLLPEVARAAVAQSGLTSAEVRTLPLFIGSSCFSIGASESRYVEALAHDSQHAIPMPLCGYQDIASIVQRTLGITGDTYTFNTACTASANALLAAVRMLVLGQYRHALVIGAELANRTTLTGFSGLQLVADTLRPFDAVRKGVVLGEGIGAVLLSAEPVATTELRLLGGANNCDSWSVTTANPDGKSIASVLRHALNHTRTQADQVRGIKAHGTATPSGDTAEARGLLQVFENLSPLSVLKPYVGHTLGACGVIELVLFAGALRQDFIPATLGFDTPDPTLGVHPLRSAVPAPLGYYLLNHFGFGGNNTVLVLEKPAS